MLSQFDDLALEAADRLLDLRPPIIEPGRLVGKQALRRGACYLGRDLDRLADEVRWLPSAPTCANWLRYGVQPAGAQAGLVPGHCTHKAHDRDNLGVGGRRVLVSRKWSGKTLAAHKADRASVVRAALEEAGIDPDDHDELAITGSDGRWSWELLGRNRIDLETYTTAIAQAITTRQRWRAEYERAKAVVAARAGPAPPDPAVA